MKVGFSLSPGGLMLPYHLGALECLEYEGHLQRDASSSSSATPVAGSSAGAIAAMVQGCGVNKRRVLEATIEVSEQAAQLGGARGQLLPLLQNQMQQLVGEEEFQFLISSSSSKEEEEENENIAESSIGIAYREVFPRPQNYLQTTFTSREDLFGAVSNSCMFPWFATNWPLRLDKRRKLSNSDNASFTSTTSTTTRRILSPGRLVVDGYFTVPRARFGCPDFNSMNMSEFHNFTPTSTATATSTKATEITDVSTSILPKRNIDDDDNNYDDYADNNKNIHHPFQKVERTVAIAVFPKSTMKIDAFAEENCISPPAAVPLMTNDGIDNGQPHYNSNSNNNRESSNSNSITPPSITDLIRIATQSTSREELTRIYELGYQNAEEWSRNENRRRQQEQR